MQQATKSHKLALSAMIAVCSLTVYSSHAALTDLTTAPLGTSTNGSVVKPNILFILDGSGSMNWKFSPDNVDPVTSGSDESNGSASYTCRSDDGGKNACKLGDPPYYADQFNGLAYNPQTRYRPGVDSHGNPLANYGSSWNSVPTDYYDSGKGITDITKEWDERGFCTVANCSSPRRNGIHNAVNGKFSYATPARPGVTGVSFTRVGTTVTGTKAGHGIVANDVIDVVGAGTCSATQVLVTAASASTFSFTWGDASKMAACTGVTGTVSYSIRGYPEQAGIALQPTTALSKVGTTVTVNFPGHGFIPGDQVDITGGTDVTYSIAAASMVKDASTKVTVSKAAHGFAVGDIIDVTAGGASCLGAGVSVTSVVNANTFTYTSTAPSGGTCSGTYTVARKGTPCNTPAAGATVTGVSPGINPTSFTVTISGTGACNGSYSVARRKANIEKSINTNPFYYTLSPVEYCADLHLTDCVASTVPTTAGSKVYDKPAYVRYCSSAALAAQAPPVSLAGATIQCVDKFFKPSYIYPRYGVFTRGDVVPSIATYGNRANRADCAAGTCTYAQEMTNIANYLAFYRRRIQSMKTAAGLAFAGLDERYRVGFLTIEPSNPVVSCTSTPCASGDDFLKIDVFAQPQKDLFYSIFYAQQPSGGTPLRQALVRAGRYFAHKTDGINAGMKDDPVQYSCQQNFALLTTDGMWGGNNEAMQLDGTSLVGNQDGNLADSSGLVNRASGTYDGGCCSNTLSDVAMYYYKTDLRTTALGNATGSLGQPVDLNNVPTTDADAANWQHMTVFSLALADGLMTWQPDYATATTGDYKNITTGASGCWWSGAGACNWPTPVSSTATTLDDLWHAAVNGHGAYFHAGDPQSLVNGLSGALAGMSARTAAAAASATSSPNITQLDNVIYSTTYETADWSGQMIAQYVDTATGAVLPTVLWSAQATLDSKVGATSDARTIYTFDDAAANHLKSFDYALMSATEQGWMNDACTPSSKLSQCAPGVLSSGQLGWLNNGANIVNFVRGQTQNEGTLLRDRKHPLGDTVDATPVYVRSPLYIFGDPGYGDFKNAKASRQPVIYLAANDGMLHAFDARVGGSSNGTELWAYVPRMLLSKLYKLADLNYASKHVFYVDGSPTVMDAYFGGSWHTVLVGGLNSGGRGYYALDITNPLSPQALWEFCSDSSVCAKSDVDMGYTYGNPVITKLPNGTWVAIVTSGYNNVSPGDGLGHLYVLDLATGTMLYKVNTTAGSLAAPSGLGRIAAYADNFQQDNTVKYVYGGDLRGNMWRFDMTGVPGTAPSAQLLATLIDGSGRPQSITTRPELANIKGNRVVYVGTGRYLGLSDLTDPASWEKPSTDAWQQSFYAFKDTGAYISNLRDTLVQQTITSAGSLSRTTSTVALDWNKKNGWFVDFNPNGESPGERVNIDPLMTLGTLNVKTNVPNANACVFGGDSWVYQFRYDTGTYVSSAPGQVVAQKITGATTVGFVIVGLPGGGLKDITTTATGEKKVFAVNIGSDVGSGKRIGWREITN